MSAALSSAAAVAVAAATLAVYWRYSSLLNHPHRRNDDSSSSSSGDSSSSAHEDLIGDTPLVLLHQLSKRLNRQIWVKMESYNPSGTGKDRAVLGMIRAAEAQGELPVSSSLSASASASAAITWGSSIPEACSTHKAESVAVEKNSATAADAAAAPSVSVSLEAMDAAIDDAIARSRTGGLVVEGTSGSTGIALAMLCQARGHACVVVLPDDQAVEKQVVLRTLGAVVLVVPTAAIANPYHYVNVARKLAQRARDRRRHHHHHPNPIQALFLDQFENPANFDMHYHVTGPEIYRQCPDLSAFVMSCGTGGTLAGVSKYLKERVRRRHFHRDIRCVLVDPPGSALYHKIQHGVIYASQQREQSLKRHRYDTIAEGIGIDRLTHNLALGLECVDAAIRVTDQDALDMAHWLLEQEGLWVGSSSAMNVVGAIQTALELPVGSKIVTIICDAGHRHVTRFWNRAFCRAWGLQWPADRPVQDRIPNCLRDVYPKDQEGKE